MATKTEYSALQAFITRDGSQIRELMHPSPHANEHGVQAQSLAEARVAIGGKTQLHRHANSEELYHITSGCGMMTRGNDVFSVQTGDTVCILPGTPHCIENTGNEDLVILCCCSPAYADADTELL
ncbi:MAG: cupin domain-containing protein [Sulfuriflexus sp.]|nr:cupin domain-containing protein [Sulfuriflexus sp.]